MFDDYYVVDDAMDGDEYGPYSTQEEAMEKVNALRERYENREYLIEGRSIVWFSRKSL